MPIKLFIFSTILLSGLNLSAYHADSSLITIKSWPIDLLLDRLVLLRSGKIATTESFRGSNPLITSFKSEEIDIDIMSNPSQLATFLRNELIQQDRLDSYLKWLENADPFAKLLTKDLSTKINRALIAESFHENTRQTRRSNRYYEVRDELEKTINAVKTFNGYQYAYGKEVGRKIIKQFDAIHRQTFFENRVHNVDIGVDFLEPVKAILRSLKLKEKFEWIFDNTLYIGYKSSFKHHKKVFMRFKGFYAKTSISFELMRRKRHWWGYGSWEIVGTASKLVEEPMAIVGTDVKELEPSHN